MTPGERMATPVKLPVGSGTASICARSRTYPLVVSTAFISGVAFTVKVVDTEPTASDTFNVAVRSACTEIAGKACVWNPSCATVML